MAEQDSKQPENNTQEDQPNTPEVELETAEEIAAAEAAAEAAEQIAPEPAEDDEVAQLHEELAAAKDAVLRAQAEVQNAKRRAEQDIEKARKFALERFAGDLLPVADNLERALESASGDDEVIKPIAEGVELTLKSLIDVLGKQNIEVVDPNGEPFDPNLHQAMSMIENPEVEPNTVIAVMQKGYTLNGRLIRPAMVMVSK
ncbi:nucleotide exchange factor GrpE [Halioglobus maricola]|uniref:nucleotide exchange factor GrpE n=1 Tax=Halioglobus maricola TaxID=2601894 RepID=UPI001F0E91EF|nr:nucleotide exchange factor GrpE [Halioglobus maricola]